MRRQLLFSLTFITIAATSALSTGCVEENSEDYQLFSASRDDSLSTIIALVADEQFTTDSTDNQISTNNTLVADCADELENTCSFLSSNQVTIISVRPGDVDFYIKSTFKQQDGEPIAAAGLIRLLDLRPETTAVIFLKRNGDELNMLTHRRITETFDDFDNNGQWIAEELPTN